jgi:hypothetical protein
MSSRILAVGTKVTIVAAYHWAKGAWGIVRSFDGEYYHVAPWNGQDACVFTRKEIKVAK